LLSFAEVGYSLYAYFGRNANLDFLLISPNNRAIGMGNAFVALADDASAAWWNPAGLVNTISSALMVAFAYEVPPPMVDFFDHNYLYISRTKPLDESTVIAFSGVQHLWGHTDRRHELLGPNFNQWDYSVAFSCGVRINNRLATGLSVKYIDSQLESRGDFTHVKQLALDAGMLYNSNQSSSCTHSFGLAIRNFGPKFRYGDKYNFKSMPSNLNAGYALSSTSGPFKNNVLFDINRRLHNLRGDTFFRDISCNMGLETWLAETVGFRTGLWFDSEVDYSIFTLGASVRINKLFKTIDVHIDVSCYSPQKQGSAYARRGRYVVSLSISQSANINNS